MAHHDIEVEIKIPITQAQYLQVQEKLRQIAECIGTTHQSDEYFTPPHRNFLEPQYPYEWLGIRRRGGKTILCYKHYYPEIADVTTHCDEFETEVSVPSKLEKIFTSLNFRPLVTVTKERTAYRYHDEFEIDLDVVEELGYFIEIEAVKDFGGVEKTREKITEFARQLALDPADQELRGYPYLLLKKKGLLGQ